MTPASEPGSGRARYVRAESSTIEMPGVAGRTFFPTPQQGPWLPFESFRESIATGPHGSDKHNHQLEEVVNYVLSGRIVHVDAEGPPVEHGPTSVVVLSVRGERRHEISAVDGQQARWVSLVVRLPKDLPEPSPSVQVVEHCPAAPFDTGVLRRDILGPSAGARSATGLEVADLEFSRPGVSRLKFQPGRRGLVYVLDGAGKIAGTPTPTGCGVLVEDTPEVEVEAMPGFRVLFSSVPTSSR